MTPGLDLAIGALALDAAGTEDRAGPPMVAMHATAAPAMDLHPDPVPGPGQAVRQVVLDTETTGLSWEKGNRVVEIGCVELVERRPTGRTFQRYLNPDCPFEPGAQEVTGLTLDFLADKPRFAEVVEDFLEFIEGAELVIHNAAFDVGFLDAELRRLGGEYGCLRDRASVQDSLEMARQRFPGQRNSLDALCRRLGVDNSHRQLHGALLDAQLLAEAYLALTAGQGEIGFGSASAEDGPGEGLSVRGLPLGPRLRIVVGSDDLAAHAARLATIRARAGATLWDCWLPA